MFRQSYQLGQSTFVVLLAACLTFPFAAAQTDATIDAEARTEVIEGVLKALNDGYVFPETAKKMEQAIRERIERKEYDNITGAAALASTLTAHLQEVSKDKHLRVIFNDGSRPMFGGGPNPTDRERARMMAAKRNFGFEKVERMSGNIGYLDLRGFEDIGAAGETAPAAMNFLANTTGDPQSLKRFHKERGGDEENAQQDVAFYQQSGGLKLHSIVRSEQFEIEVLANTKNGGRWVSFAVGVEPQPPHGIADIRVRPTSAPDENGGGREDSIKPNKEKHSEAEIIEHLNALIDKQSADDNFSSAVLVARNGIPIFQRAVGLASKQYNAPNRIDTKFNLGSINKIFTKIAIGQLIEQGKLSFGDTIGKHLPDYPNKDAAAKVTIKHLLDMQSGIGDFFGPRFEATPKDRIRGINDYLPLFASEPLKFEPGMSRAYSNGGYIVLGAIIEKVTGQSYYDFVRERIFKPAGMENTDSYEVDANVPNLATGYLRNEKGERVSNVYTKPARGSSAGGGYSTVEDLLKFTIALQKNKLLSADQTKRMMQGGLGIAGGAPGINAALEIDPASGYTIIVLSNYGPPSAGTVSEQIRKLIAKN